LYKNFTRNLYILLNKGSIYIIRHIIRQFALAWERVKQECFNLFEVYDLSFSASVKNELCRTEASERCCMLSELAAVMRISGNIEFAGENAVNIKITTENAAFARRVFSLVKVLLNIYPEVSIKRAKKLKKHVTYTIVVGLPRADQLMEAVGIGSKGEKGGHPADESPVNSECPVNIKKLLKKKCCRKAYLRGAFLASGSITNPEKTYHVEITTHNLNIALDLVKLMSAYGLNAKVVKRKGSFVTYLKEGENIVDFLNIIGAHSALLELENVRILKEMRNNVNRIVNCETANLEKTVNASVRQIENIKFIRDEIGFDNLPKGLKEIAELRLKYTDASLKELGEMLAPPLGKSGVNHRLRKLDIIAEKGREMQDGRKDC